MKVFIQIPCLNEEQTLPLVLQSIPSKIPGVDTIEILVIDDGSTDKTVEVAKRHGVHHFVHHIRNMGLGRSFKDGTDYALAHGADIVVNTDGDNQYPQERIADLVRPIIAGQAEIVIGDRQTHTVAHFSPLKKKLQKLGSRVINGAAGTDLPDAASGFRAYSKESLIQLNPVTRFSYCMETIIQAGNKRLAITSIPITINPQTRESRLFTSIHEYIYKSMIAILRSYIMYKPYVLFTSMSVLFFTLGLIPYIMYLILAITHKNPGSHLQSLLVGAILLIVGVFCALIGVVADLNRVNRMLIEDSLEHTKRARFGSPGSRKKA